MRGGGGGVPHDAETRDGLGLGQHYMAGTLPPFPQIKLSRCRPTLDATVSTHKYIVRGRRGLCRTAYPPSAQLTAPVVGPRAPA